MMHFLHETREPLVDPLAHRTGACVSARYDPNHRIHRHDFEDFGELDPDMSTRFLVRINRRKVRLLGCVLHNERHADANGECDSRGHPKQPAPVQRRNPYQTEKRKSGEQRGPELENPKPAEVDHKTEDTSKAAALGMLEPSRVNFHHSGCAECLEVAVDPTN